MVSKHEWLVSPDDDAHAQVHVIQALPWVVAVNKPAGVPSVPGRTPSLADCVWSRLRSTHTDALVVHRLDMATSGVMIFARGSLAQRRLSDAFQSRQVHKRYVAEVHGMVVDDAGTMTWPLSADWPRRPRQQVDNVHGKPCTTHYRVLLRDVQRHTTRLELTPITGRSHQLRVHCLTLGHAIVGDALYGEGDGAATMRLHATRIEIPDLTTALDGLRRVAFESSVPSWL